MDTLKRLGLSGGRRRRTYTAEYKAKAIAACRAPGVSVAAVALNHGLNANLLRRWVSQAESDLTRSSSKREASVAQVLHKAPTAFLPLKVEPPALSERSIEVELRRGTLVMKVSFPLEAGGVCGTWLRKLLR